MGWSRFRYQIREDWNGEVQCPEHKVQPSTSPGSPPNSLASVDVSLLTHRLISAFSRFLPDLKATFSIFDQPQIYLSWARRGSLVDLGLSGKGGFGSRSDFVRPRRLTWAVTEHLQETDDATVRLSRSCPPESNYRTNASFAEGESLTIMMREGNC